ncbi:MAG: hypothetical protein ACQESB_03120 [Elusimicrobiota bacterium]
MTIVYKKIKTLLTKAAVLALIFTAAGCSLENLADYSTPRKSYESYVRHAKTLRIVADHRNYRRAIRCFSDEDRNWFEKNFRLLKELPEFELEEDIYRHLYLTKRKAYVFGRALVPAGPPLDADYEVEEISDNEAVVKIEGYETPIQMIKSSDRWQMKGLFGLKEKVSE